MANNITKFFTKPANEIEDAIYLRYYECSKCPAKQYCDEHYDDKTCMETFRDWALMEEE